MKDSTVSSDLAFPNHAHHGDFFLVGLRSPADLGTCLFTGDLTHSLLDQKSNTHGDVAAKQVYGIHVRASYSLENKNRPKHGYARCVGRRNGRRRGWEPATLEQLGSQGNGNLYAGRAQYITSYHHISSTKPSLETCCMGKGEQNFQKFWLK